MSGPAVQRHTWPNKGRRSYARRKFSYLLSLDCRRIMVPVRLLHRYRRTHQVHLQVQQQRSDDQAPWRSDTKNPKTKLKERQRWSIAIAKPPRIVGGVRRKSRTYRSACTCTHFSHDSESERPTKVASRKHSIFAENFGDLITADQKVLNEEGESRNNHGYAVVVQDLDTQCVQSYPCQNTDFTGDGKEFTKVPRAFTKAKSYLHGQLIHWSLANLVKFFHGIIERQRLLGQRQMALLKDPYEEWKKELQQYCCNQAWMKNGGLVLWHATAICEMSKTSWQTGKLLTKDDSENHSTDQFFFWNNGWISSDFDKGPVQARLCCWCRRKHETKARRSCTQTSPRSYQWKKDEFYESLQSCSQIHSDAQRRQWRRNGKNWRKSRHGSWRKSETRKRWSMK